MLLLNIAIDNTWQPILRVFDDETMRDYYILERRKISFIEFEISFQDCLNLPALPDEIWLVEIAIFCLALSSGKKTPLSFISFVSLAVEGRRYSKILVVSAFIL